MATQGRLAVSLLLLQLLGWSAAQNTDEAEAAAWALQYTEEAQVVYFNDATGYWNYQTNITDYNLAIAVEGGAASAAFDKLKGEEADSFAWEGFSDYSLKRQFSKIGDLGYSVLPEAQYQRYSELNNEMEAIYSTAKVCNRPGDTSGTCYPLEPDLVTIMANSTDWDELIWAWQGFRNESGRKMPDMYQEFAGLLNTAATMNGYADNGEYWRFWYEDPEFRAQCEGLWDDLRPHYEQLHTYVRRKLKERYPNEPFPSSGHIPAHILGNMWAQDWSALEPLMRPFPDKPGLDVTDALVEQGYNATGLFILANEFFTSLGMEPMPQPFWDKSMILKPDDREVVCHASAWDFMNQIDFRIKQCTEINTKWLITTHHEMGHIEYDLQYKEQPVPFRNGVNPGFHEAIGDTIALSVSTPTHMQSIGLLEAGAADPEVDMNFLMLEALKKIAFIPFGYLIDQWRWDLFAGVFPREDYNSNWWDVRFRYQGVAPPVTRSAGGDFDAGAKYHVPANTPYIRYFVSHVLQYQFQKAMCDAAGFNGPLHQCDFYQSSAAGDLLADVMKLAASLPWPDALERITGTRTMSVGPLVQYFDPLFSWLDTQNVGETPGWTDACPTGSVEFS